ncbi:hypothetical protein N9V90_00650 [Endozoicomonas sp.]|nr:hypothetical protein [Endozoicomonas sp.]
MDVPKKLTFSGRSVLFASTLSAILLTPTPLYSATQGSLGATSSASMTITLIIPPKLVTTVASEIPINSPILPTTANLNNPIPLCVKSNGLPSYTVTASGHTEQGGFALQNGSAQVPYDVLLQTRADGNPKPLYSGQPSDALRPLARNEPCEGTSELAVRLKQPLDYTQSIVGAMNLTISAD